MNSTDVDVIIPNFNKGIYLDECINSVLKQDFQSWKLYIIDDNSSDSSHEILSKFEKKS